MRTPLYDYHLNQKAKIVDFHGWDLPIYYTSIIEEHIYTRKKAGLFDICHMGILRLPEESSLKSLQNLTVNNIEKLKTGDIQYSLVLNENGGIKDDILVYKMESGYLVVVNASNKDKIFTWFKEHSSGVDIQDLNLIHGMIALQGPLAIQIMEKLLPGIGKLGYYKIMIGKILGVDTMISRTGYTGEDGVEIYPRKEDLVKLWNAILNAGKDVVRPIGLGARDTLRLEAGLPLYGNELEEDINPFEAVLDRYIALNEKDFIGKQALLKIKASRKLVGLELQEKAIPRQGFRVMKENNEVGIIASGSYAPTLEKSIATAFVKTGEDKIGNEVEVEIRNKPYKALIVKKPFYKRGKV